ncbi:unnamed protein product, partial [Phaeothamnion confervicola]
LPSSTATSTFGADAPREGRRSLQLVFVLCFLCKPFALPPRPLLCLPRLFLFMRRLG